MLSRDGTFNFWEAFDELPDSFLDGIKVISYPDVPYACQSPAQVMDIYLPPGGKKPYPVLMYFHGGGFIAGSKVDKTLKAVLPFLRRGLALVSVGYRYSSEATFPAQIFDAKAAVRHIRTYSGEYGLNPDAIAAIGVSTGGWLCGMLGTTADYSAYENPADGYRGISSAVQAAVLWGSPCGDLLEMDYIGGKPFHTLPDSDLSLMMGGPLGEKPELCRMANLTALVSGRTAPLLVFHGANDVVYPIRHAKLLVETARRQNGEGAARLILGRDAGRYGDKWFLQPERTDEVCDFLSGVFGTTL